MSVYISVLKVWYTRSYNQWQIFIISVGDVWYNMRYQSQTHFKLVSCKIWFPQNYFAIALSFGNFAQSMAVILPCSVQNCKMIEQLTCYGWTTFHKTWVLRWVIDRYRPILHPSHGNNMGSRRWPLLMLLISVINDNTLCQQMEDVLNVIIHHYTSLTLVLRPKHSRKTRPIPWLIIPWLLAVPGHQ